MDNEKNVEDYSKKVPIEKARANLFAIKTSINL